MKIRIRPAHPEDDRRSILDVLERNLPAASDPARYDWLYLGNPAGQALVWLATDESGAAVGTSAAHPRVMRLGDKTVTALNLSDFAIDTEYRSIGPAMKLMRATLEPIENNRYAFAYDHPSAAMRAVHMRLRGVDLDSITRFTRPLSLVPIVERKLGKNFFAQLVGRIANPLLRLQLPKATVGSLELSVHSGQFTDEFAAVAIESTRTRRSIATVLGKDFLNWRFHEHPIWKHRIVCARRAGRLLGFGVFKEVDESVCVVVEVVGADDVTIVALLNYMLRLACRTHADRIDAPVPASAPLAKSLLDSGFFERESNIGPTIFASPEYASDTRIVSKMDWCMTEGDRDV